MASLSTLLKQVTTCFYNTADLTGVDAPSPAVLKAMLRTPRQQFVSANERAEAYENYPLPIGFGQTISQPFIVALMSTVLELEKSQRILEIGTGSGYQTAILAQLVHQVISIERVPSLMSTAQKRLKDLRLDNVQLLHGDGALGAIKYAPFQAIMVTASALEVPQALLDQLDTPGLMVIPVCEGRLSQALLLLRKSVDGTVISERLLTVQFVPLITGELNAKP